MPTREQLLAQPGGQLAGGPLLQATPGGTGREKVKPRDPQAVASEIRYTPGLGEESEISPERNGSVAPIGLAMVMELDGSLLLRESTGSPDGVVAVDTYSWTEALQNVGLHRGSRNGAVRLAVGGLLAHGGRSAVGRRGSRPRRDGPPHAESTAAAGAAVAKTNQRVERCTVSPRGRGARR
jgi:hypothetical protein